MATTAAKTIKRFNIGEVTEPVKFMVDEDEFEAIPANRLPAGVLAKYFTAINDSRIFDAHEFFFGAILVEDSLKLFNERLDSVEKPITVGIMGDVAAWLLGEVYLQGEVSAEAKPS